MHQFDQWLEKLIFEDYQEEEDALEFYKPEDPPEDWGAFDPAETTERDPNKNLRVEVATVKEFLWCLFESKLINTITLFIVCVEELADDVDEVDHLDGEKCDILIMKGTLVESPTNKDGIH